MSILFENALAAAVDVCASQHRPPSALYVLATPIGNLADITLRALAVLHAVAAIACEDTRHTGQLLRTYRLPFKPLLAVHQHNEAEAAAQVVARLQQGQSVAYVSDAGTPAISDPGARLVQAVDQAGYPVIPIPGASSAIAAMSVAGVVQEGGFTFIGFLPSNATERSQALHAAFAHARAVVLFEAPHRINTLAKELASLAEQLGQRDRMITIARELTKQFEQVTTTTPHQWLANLANDAHGAKGEFVVVIHPPEQMAAVLDTRVLDLLLKEMPLKTAVKLAAEITGQSKNALYAAALQKNAAGEGNGLLGDGVGF